MDVRRVIYGDIDAERRRQTQKWNKPHEWGFGDCSSRQVDEITKVAVLCEECGEVARAVLDGGENLRNELIQVAAVAVAWLESLEA